MNTPEKMASMSMSPGLVVYGSDAAMEYLQTFIITEGGNDRYYKKLAQMLYEEKEVLVQRELRIRQLLREALDRLDTQ